MEMFWCFEESQERRSQDDLPTRGPIMGNFKHPSFIIGLGDEVPIEHGVDFPFLNYYDQNRWTREMPWWEKAHAKKIIVEFKEDTLFRQSLGTTVVFSSRQMLQKKRHGVVVPKTVSLLTELPRKVKETIRKWGRYLKSGLNPEMHPLELPLEEEEEEIEDW